jgi:L-alanine-DL-glutamate epimerase-like enolase superfamily enzyme
MKITDMRCWIHRTPRTEDHVTAQGRSSEAVNVVVELTAGRWKGVGAATQNDVTRESADSIVFSMEKFYEGIVDREFYEPVQLAERLDDIIDDNFAAKAGVDIAFHDLLSHSKRRRLMDYLYGLRGNRGMAKERMLTDVTVGISSDTNELIEKIKGYVDEGYMAVKLEIGSDPQGDLQLIHSIRGRLGKGFTLRLDASQGYTVDQAVEFVGELGDLAIEFIEQPVDAADLAGLEEVSIASPVPVMADEAIWTAEDAEHIGESDICDLINIKLMKCGGLTRAMQILEQADKVGLRSMIGCMAEGRASLSAALALAVSQEDVIYADLDSFLRLQNDYSTGGLSVDDGYLVPGDDAGMSVELLDNEGRGRRIPLESGRRGEGGRSGRDGGRKGRGSGGDRGGGGGRRDGGGGGHRGGSDGGGSRRGGGDGGGRRGGGDKGGGGKGGGGKGGGGQRGGGDQGSRRRRKSGDEHRGDATGSSGGGRGSGGGWGQRGGHRHPTDGEVRNSRGHDRGGGGGAGGGSSGGGSSGGGSGGGGSSGGGSGGGGKVSGGQPRGKRKGRRDL